MLDSKSSVYTAPAIAARILEFQNNGNIPPMCLVENFGSTASASVVYQESDNGVDWADIPTTSVSVSPGQSSAQFVVSVKARLALKAGGNTTILFTVSRQVNGSPANLGAA